MKKYKRLSIYPKAIQQKSITEFTAKEKKQLLKKRWYVYYDYLHPITQQWVQQPSITMKANYQKDFSKRYKAIHRVLSATKDVLDTGLSPYNTLEENSLSFEQALDKAFELKKTTLGEATVESYEIAVTHFKKWLNRRKLLEVNAKEFPLVIIREYFNELQGKSIATHNSYLAAIRAVFTLMYENDYVKENYTRRIKIIKTAKTEKRFNVYTQEEVEMIFNFLEEKDPVMALYLKFISYNFLRPVEVSRLTIGDIDMKNKELTVDIKTANAKHKRIPNELIEELEKLNLSRYAKSDFLFTPTGPGKWEIPEKGRRDHFTKKYGRYKKKLGFNTDYNMYSFRHTFITLGYRNLRKRLLHEAAIDELMRYTGHTERTTLSKYIRYHHAEIVEDYANIIE